MTISNSNKVLFYLAINKGTHVYSRKQYTTIVHMKLKQNHIHKQEYGYN